MMAYYRYIVIWLRRNKRYSILFYSMTKRKGPLQKACNVEDSQHLKYDQVSGLNEFFSLNSICKS
jgi:hypothetical protein